MVRNRKRDKGKRGKFRRPKILQEEKLESTMDANNFPLKFSRIADLLLFTKSEINQLRAFFISVPQSTFFSVRLTKMIQNNIQYFKRIISIGK